MNCDEDKQKELTENNREQDFVGSFAAEQRHAAYPLARERALRANVTLLANGVPVRPRFVVG